ncbi:hypothetical protein M011DRAFT_454710 [Sporormia fimetaria CBS 119925]|uniref:Uncharacterized protein n=1 Tax=Sporormia fimetaria CBS 119925 TaxID=1340428 RepID=A0A6A6VRG6_9PLEO|nr:hypothetical protein M011DRAFT_454710 [Sporormia fimetaria CBS 119925]
MPGNPFRTSQLLTSPVVGPPAPPASLPSTESPETAIAAKHYDPGNTSPPTPPTTKDSARIGSSPASTPHPALHGADDSLQQHAHNLSPLPASPYGTPQHLGDMKSADIHAQDANSQRDSAREERQPDMEAPIRTSSRAPVNPFARTLATLELHDGHIGEQHTPGDHRDQIAAEKRESRASKANLDVEGFKRLLMTGVSTPSTPDSLRKATLAGYPGAPSTFESNSTDSSSISRHSIFEAPQHERHGETPRTSYDMAPSDEERVGLVSDIKKTEKKKPPPAPKHRHGKLVSPRAPQTVSFSDFEAGPSAPLPTPPRRTGSDLNKPLPPTPHISSPPAQTASQDGTQGFSPDVPTPDKEGRDLVAEGNIITPPKKVPPPVPLSRRQSQLRSSGGTRSRSSSIRTVSSEHSTEFPALSPHVVSEPSSLSGSHKTPPPPPPSRRHGSAVMGGNASSTNSSTTELPSILSARRTDSLPPQPPPSRRTTVSAKASSPMAGKADLARTSSLSSNRVTPRSVSSESATMAPPPPPPRRRVSGRSSIEIERPQYPPSVSSMESRLSSSESKRRSFDGKRRTSVASESSLRNEYAPSVDHGEPLYTPNEEVEEPQSIEPVTIPASTPNILEDMEKFQREIDELRERYQKGS